MYYMSKLAVGVVIRVKKIVQRLCLQDKSRIIRDNSPHSAFEKGTVLFVPEIMLSVFAAVVGLNVYLQTILKNTYIEAA